MSPSLNVLLDRLEAAKNRFGGGAGAESKLLLDQISRSQVFPTPSLSIRFHEVLLFLRAFPQSASLVPRIEKLLNTFRERVEEFRQLDSDMSAFDDFDTSGIAGTTTAVMPSVSDAARWLVRRIPRNIEIAWDDYSTDYEAERMMGSAWPRSIPLLEEDADIEANIPWRQWLNAARGRQKDFEWLIRKLRTAAGHESRAR